ncbi:hypothetical protein H6P81_002734 [Aristolochia fimbriata]|uniref:Uncharacterized protein n=1 Tax=Aristolochia fimbriata TaxID=158543 RepID=A0AAV7FBR3_ARIFI|nr:hypothetical protein H6P81_002734 [Aristolochia fimbriata]
MTMIVIVFIRASDPRARSQKLEKTHCSCGGTYAGGYLGVHGDTSRYKFYCTPSRGISGSCPFCFRYYYVDDGHTSCGCDGETPQSIAPPTIAIIETDIVTLGVMETPSLVTPPTVTPSETQPSFAKDSLVKAPPATSHIIRVYSAACIRTTFRDSIAARTFNACACTDGGKIHITS